LQHRAIAYVKMRDSDRALADGEAAIQIAPNNPFVHNVRGVAYRLKGEYDRAIAEHDTAISLAPRQAQFFYTRGLVYRWKGDYNRAIADYSRAIALNPAHALAYGGRAFIYRMQLDFAHALADHEAEIRLTPQAPAPTYTTHLEAGCQQSPYHPSGVPACAQTHVCCCSRAEGFLTPCSAMAPGTLQPYHYRDILNQWC